MKIKFWNLSLCLSMILAMTALWSCSDNDEPNAPIIEVAEPENISATSAVFKLKAESAESYVCKIIEGANAPEPNPVIVFKEAEEKGTIKKVTETAITETVAGLEGNKTYSVFFVFKTANGYTVICKQLNTKEYTQKVTIIETGMFHVKVHVEVPEDTYYSIGIAPLENYIGLQQFGNTDLTWVSHDEYSGLASPRYKGPQTITMTNGVFSYAGSLNEQECLKDLDEYGLTEADYAFNIKPGTPYVIFMGQCDENGMTAAFIEGELQGGGGWPGLLNASVLPNIKEYTEDCPEDEGLKFVGNFAKVRFMTQQADKGTGKVEIKATRITEKTAIVNLTPSEDVLQYAVLAMDNKVLEEDIYKITEGEDGMQAMALIYGQILEGEQQIILPLEKDHTYSIYATSVYNEEGTLQTLDKINDLKPIVSNKPAAELIVTALKFDNPYKIGFNIKAPNKDCIGFKYLMNYTHEWYPMMNSFNLESKEAVIAAMVDQFGVGVNDAATMQEVNSEKGHDLIFSSMDDTESWIAFESYNEDEKTKLYWDGPANRNKSCKLKPLPKVNSDLMQKLQGTWECTMTNLKGKTVTKTITISDGPEYVASMPAEVKDKLVSYYVKHNGYTQAKAEEMVNRTFNEYQTLQQYYTEKYQSQNYLVGTGFSYDNYYSVFASSWDLFQSTEYSSYSTEEMFRDYGPKIFFQFEEDQNGKVSIIVPTTRESTDGMNYLRYVDPMADWSMTLQLFGCNPDQKDNFFMSDFPVEVSQDLNTLTIKPMIQDGITYTPSIARQFNGRINVWGFQTNADGIVLKRVNTAKAMRIQQMNAPVEVPAVMSHKGNNYKRTRAPYGFTVKEPLHMKVFSTDLLKKNSKR